jgi:hypothetical protein
MAGAELGNEGWKRNTGIAGRSCYVVCYLGTFILQEARCFDFLVLSVRTANA